MKFRAIITSLFLALCLCAFFVASADAAASSNQSAGSHWFNESGLIMGIGTSDLDDGRHYEPILVIWHLSKDLNPYLTALLGHRGKLSFICEPQINPSFKPSTDIEAGIGLGLKYSYPLISRLDAYVMGSVGPHFMSLKTDEQHSGFLFADTIGAGLDFKLSSGAAINLGYRFRHMSNAGLKKPNSGVNTQFITVGYSIFF